MSALLPRLFRALLDVLDLTGASGGGRGDSATDKDKVLTPASVQGAEDGEQLAPLCTQLGASADPALTREGTTTVPPNNLVCV